MRQRLEMGEGEERKDTRLDENSRIERWNGWGGVFVLEGE